MDEDKLKVFKKIIEKSTCPRGCKCHKIAPEELCKARQTDLGNLLERMEERPMDCPFSVPFGGSYFCKCQTRIELGKLLVE